jgi:transposase-like protein
MIPNEFLEDYLIDQEDGLKKLLTWFLNLVMQLEAMEQINAKPYERVESRTAHRNGCQTGDGAPRCKQRGMFAPSHGYLKSNSFN